MARGCDCAAVLGQDSWFDQLRWLIVGSKAPATFACIKQCSKKLLEAADAEDAVNEGLEAADAKDAVINGSTAKAKVPLPDGPILHGSKVALPDGPISLLQTSVEL